MDRSYEVYRYYLALRLHFTTDQYDAIKQRGRVRASRQAFYKRKDLLSIRKVAENYSNKEIVDFLVANFTSGDRWGGVFDVNAKERYLNWKKRIESLTYTFEKEIGKLSNYCDTNNVEFNVLFEAKNEQGKVTHPYIIKQYLRNSISIETLVILGKFYNFIDKLDNDLGNDVIWPDLSRIIKKYDPFLTIDKEKYARILRRAVGFDQ